MMRRFLLVDDEAAILSSLQRALRQMVDEETFEFELFTNPIEAIARCGEIPFDVVISDNRMPQMFGVDFFRVVKEIQPNAMRLLLTASTEFETIMGAVNDAQVFKYLVKPWVNAELEETIKLALSARDALVEDQRLAELARRDLNAKSPIEKEIIALEEAEPGITKVDWGPDGSVILGK
ncbi:MAG: response regulator [Undibacterium sp.]|nr:response regulator [Undibacterium sp.]